MLAVPVIVGSLGRIPLGALADRYGGRLMFAAICFFAALPVAGLALAESYSYILIAGLLLGVAGASFAVGVPFVNAWFPPKKRGLMLGIYSMGNAGTAISGLLTPQLHTHFGGYKSFFVVAALLVVMGLIFAKWGRNSPDWERPKHSALGSFWLAAGQRSTWDLSLLYALTFGAFVAFSVYLPMLLKTTYDLSLADAAARAAGFVFLATAARPLGGWLSDKFGGKNVIRGVLALVAVLPVAITVPQTLSLPATSAYLSLAIALGCGSGAVIALVSQMSKPATLGSVTGIVGASGGLGGFLPPLVLGVTYQQTGSYTLAILMLAATALLLLAYIHLRFKRVQA